MPETSDAGRQLAPAQLTQRLAALVHGPYDYLDTTGAVGLAAEAVRYLNHADGLADALITAHTLRATLHATRSATPIAPRNGTR